MTLSPFFHITGAGALERIVELTGTTTIGRAATTRSYWTTKLSHSVT